MDNTYDIIERVAKDGFAVIDGIFTEEEVEQVLSVISMADTSQPTFRKSASLFAIRQFFREIPAALGLVFTERLHRCIRQVAGDEFFIVKSIYFDKPENSNWFVSYHQDLTISVDRKIGLEGFGPWTAKHNQFAVQPPLSILEDNFTIRIHLDDTDGENGALRVIPGSHLKGVYRPETIDWKMETEVVCRVPKGGIMIMKPLLLHSSGRTTNSNKRRVIHIEFSRSTLPGGLNWAEYITAKATQ